MPTSMGGPQDPAGGVRGKKTLEMDGKIEQKLVYATTRIMTGIWQLTEIFYSVCNLKFAISCNAVS